MTQSVTPRPRRTRPEPEKKTSIAAALLKIDGSNDDTILDSIDFTAEPILFDPDHVKLCRAQFSRVPLLDFIAMMQRARKLGINPLTDVWQTGDNTFLLRLAAMLEYANRTKRYAPGESPAVFVRDERLKSDTNPEGLVSCTITIRMRTEDGTWHTCPGEAFWKDLVPLTGGKQNERGVYEGGWVSDRSGWASMPSTMLRKCAFVDALRKAFPELGSFHIKEEMESVGNQPTNETARAPIVTSGKSAMVSAPAATSVDPHAPSTSVRWASGMIETVPLEQFFEITKGHLGSYSPRETVRWFDDNLTAREDFHRHDKSSGNQRSMALKTMLDEARAKLPSEDAPLSRRATPRRSGRGVAV